MNIPQEMLDEIIFKWLKNLEDLKSNPGWQLLDKESFHKIKNEVYKKYKLAKPIPSIKILERYLELVKNWKYEENNTFKKLLRKRWVRSLSWVTVISLLTKSFYCPWKCIYCPTFEGLPKSYIPNEPAVMRAELNKFDPILQIHNRLRALEVTGHKIEKNDVRIIGWTRTVYPKEYKDEFIKSIYDAFNTYDDIKNFIEETNMDSDKFASFKIKETYKAKISKSLEEAKKLNETARCRIIWIAIETRPDWINLEEIKELRRYGVTRVEIWYQTTIDEINKLNKRWHWNKESIEATKLLKNAWFKVVAHMMPNLLWSNPELDKKSLREVFDNPDFRPDELKIYPMVVTDKSELTQVWKDWWFKAYDDETLINLTVELEKMIPEYVRLNRTYRDIPASEILEGSKISNLRQIVEDRIKKEWVNLVDIRNREIKEKLNNPQNAILNTYKYEASWWTEYFLTFEDPEDRTIFSLLRLRLPEWNKNVKNTSLLTPLLTDEGDLGKTSNVLWNYQKSADYIIALAKKLRKENTNTEKLLWELLRNRNFMWIKFRRQHPFWRYIADFYSNEINLVIEIDWDIHENKDQIEYDKIRDKIIQKYQVKIIKIKNKEFENIEKLLNKLENFISPLACKERGRGWGIPELKNSALIREIHTFWDQLSIWEKWSTFWQHLGFWKKLILEAEIIAKNNWYNKMAVIAWVWVRWYYEKRWYKLEWEYMVKEI